MWKGHLTKRNSVQNPVTSSGELAAGAPSPHPPSPNMKENLWEFGSLTVATVERSPWTMFKCRGLVLG